MIKTMSAAAALQPSERRIVACHQNYIADFLRRERDADERMAMFTDSEDDDDDEEEPSYILQKVGNVAIVEVKGRLTNVDRNSNRYYGLLSYSEIQRAYAQIAGDDSITAIIEDYDTPGGSVAMMAETEQIMREVGKVKPRSAFVGSMSASAGYFLMRGCNSVTISSMAEIGSIGVMQVVADMVKMYDNFGIGLKVIKSGDLKAAGNPFEKLTEDQEKYLEGQVSYLANMFYEAVAADRKMTVADLAESGITSGRTFIGQQALRAGLADAIGSFTDLLIDVANRSKSGTTAPNSQTIYSEGVDMKKRKVVAPATVAALVAGVTGPDASVTPEQPDAAAVVGEETADVVDEVKAENETTSDTIEEEEGAAATVDGDRQEAVETAVLREALATAKAELKETQREQFKAEAKIEQLEKSLTSSKEETAALQLTAAKLSAIVGDVMNNMNIALGRGKQDASTLSGEEVVSRYAAIKEEFSQAYLAGGVTGAVDNESDTNKKPFRDSSQQAVIDSVGL